MAATAAVDVLHVGLVYHFHTAVAHGRLLAVAFPWSQGTLGRRALVVQASKDKVVVIGLAADSGESWARARALWMRGLPNIDNRKTPTSRVAC